METLILGFMLVGAILAFGEYIIGFLFLLLFLVVSWSVGAVLVSGIFGISFLVAFKWVVAFVCIVCGGNAIINFIYGTAEITSISKGDYRECKVHNSPPRTMSDNVLLGK